MQPPSSLARTTSLALYLGAATGCFADPGAPIGGTDGSVGTASTNETTGEPTSGPTTAGETTEGDTTGAIPGSCGNSQIDLGEECDNGYLNNGQNGSICKGNCTKNVCGDGYLAANEGCDDGNQVDDDQCSNTCKLAGCGDGVAAPGEQCDDGNPVNDDACSNLCKSPFCGDNNVGADEQCDEGDDNGDAQACTLQCKPAVCGDGLVHAGVEGCDDGNQITDDACSNSCTLSTCGDGLVQEGEACDDGNQVDGDGCSNVCQVSCGDGSLDPGEECDDGNLENGDACDMACMRTALRVFVTSQRYEGNLGGLIGADNTCNQLAMAAQLGGKYLAWLSDTEEGPAQRFVPSALPYALVNGTTIANNWAALTSGKNLLAPINTTEVGVVLPDDKLGCDDSLVWTHTNPLGQPGPGSHCNSWTNDQAVFKGQGGNLFSIGQNWTDNCTANCSINAHLYCFEQP